MLRPILLTLLLFIGWVGSEPAHAEPPASTLDRIRETGIIRIGYSDFAAPFSYLDNHGTVSGYAIDLCHRVVDLIRQKQDLPEITIKYVMRTPSDRVTLIKDGSVDIDCAASTNTPERRQSVAFSYSNFFTPTQFVALKANNLHKISDLAGHSVASTSGSINVGVLNAESRAHKLNIAVVPAPNIDAGFRLVTEGRASAFAMDGILLANLIAQSEKPGDYELSGETFGPSMPYGFMTRHDDVKFHDAVNDALRVIYTSGEAETIYNKWFMSPIPPRGITLNVPLSDMLRRLFANPTETTE